MTGERWLLSWDNALPGSTEEVAWVDWVLVRTVLSDRESTSTLLSRARTKWLAVRDMVGMEQREMNVSFQTVVERRASWKEKQVVKMLRGRGYYIYYLHDSAKLRARGGGPAKVWHTLKASSRAGTLALDGAACHCPTKHHRSPTQSRCSALAVGQQQGGSPLWTAASRCLDANRRVDRFTRGRLSIR